VWTQKKVLKGANTNNPVFTGKGARIEYGKLKSGAPTDVPVENTGGPGTANSHWRERVFANELMTGFVGAAGNPLSRMTAASLADIGYVVDLNAAEAYKLPDHLLMAEAAVVATPAVEGVILPIIPTIAPEESLQ
jgi:hypothetical protein